MRKRFAGILLSIALTLTASGPAIYAAPAAPKGWEAVKAERSDAKEVAQVADITIKTFRGGITVTSGHAVSIKVFTILGQLVSSDTLPAGTSQLMLPQRGMYIVKVGDITCKIVI